MSTSEHPGAVSDTRLLKALAKWFYEKEDGSLQWGLEQGSDILQVLEPEEAAALKAFRTKHSLNNDQFT